MEYAQPIISIIHSEIDGPTVAIFAGVHGNEKAGIMVIERLKNELQISRGTVYLVIANPTAVEKSVRQIAKNLNRNIFQHTEITCDEDNLANNLISILDDSVALLDLHSFNEPENHPFIICESNSNIVAQNMNFKFIVNGMNQYSDGATDGYMNKQGKIALCAELGSSEIPEKYVDLGIQTALQFLKYFDIIDADVIAFSSVKPKILDTYRIYKKKAENFTFLKEFKTFDSLNAGELIAWDDNTNIVAQYEDSYILFPRPNNPIGVEAFALARKYDTLP